MTGRESVPVVVRLIGPKNSGKTTLGERLVAILRGRGRRVAAVKHSHHPAPPDREHSDSGRLAGAGAQATAFVGPDATVVRHASTVSLGRAIELVGGAADIVIVEGFRNERIGLAIELTGAPEWHASLALPDGGQLTAPSREAELLAGAIETYCDWDRARSGSEPPGR